MGFLQLKERTKYRIGKSNHFIYYLTAAFDHIPRKWLFSAIKIHFPDKANPKLFDILEKLYDHTSLTFQKAITSFLVSPGVRQGGPESPLLFNLYIDFVIRVFISKCDWNGMIHFYQHKYWINARSVTRENVCKCVMLIRNCQENRLSLGVVMQMTWYYSI